MLFWKIIYYFLVFCVFEMLMFWFFMAYDAMLRMIGILEPEEEPCRFWYFAVTMAHAVLFDVMTSFKFQDVIICMLFFCSARIWAALMQLHVCSAKEFIISMLIHGIAFMFVQLPG